MAMRKKSNPFRRTPGEVVFDVFNVMLMLLITAAMLYPLVHVIALSLSGQDYIRAGAVSMIPKGFNLEGYKYVANYDEMFRAYGNTIAYAGVGTLITLLATSLIAYPLSIGNFVAKKFVTILLAITMFFNGGLIPTYLIIKNYGMLNTFWVMVLPGAVSAYNVFVYRSFFATIPSALRETAYIDGASDLRILFQIVLPLSTALLATFGLFSVVGHWNSWFGAFIYLNDSKRWPIQMILRNLLIQGEIKYGTIYTSDTLHSKTIQMAVTVVTMAPILCAYPFAQKYFVKGVMVGSIKG